MFRTRRLIGSFATFTTAFVGAVICMSALALASTLAVARYTHGLLASAGGADLLDLTQGQANRLSDQTISALLNPFANYQAIVWPDDGTPFYAPDEISHLQDVSQVVVRLLGLGLVCAIVLMIMTWKSSHGRALKLGIACGSTGLMLSILACSIWGWNDFDGMFRTFHKVFFPEGNFSFDPETSALVNLFPPDYWAHIGAVLVIALLAIYALGFLTHLVRARWQHHAHMSTLRRATTEVEPA